MKPYYKDDWVKIFHGACRDVLPGLPAASVNCCVTSPPYWGLRDYGVDGQLGLERTPEEYVAKLVAVFREVRRVLRDDGTVWLNLGDSYANEGKWGGSSGGKHAAGLHGCTGIGRGKTKTGLKPKDLVGIPWRVAFALQADGWYLRQDIIWHKPNPMPESVTDRCTKAHEYIFLLSKSARYWYDAEAIAEPAMQPLGVPSLVAQHKQAILGMNQTGTLGTNQGPETRNKRSVWTVQTKPYKDAHFAAFPPDLIGPCILAGCPQGGTVMDCFGGTGTTARVCKDNGRHCISIELNAEYLPMQEKRLAQEVLPL